MNDCLLKLCSHRAADGSLCRAPAVRESDYCRHHRGVHRPPVIFPAWVFETATHQEITAALQRAMTGIGNGTINQKFGGQILHEISKRINALAKEGSNKGSPRSKGPTNHVLNG